MLDLVLQETQRIDSRFLEPACGNGNFLAEVLRRKLEIVENRYKQSQLEFERYCITAVCSVYGIDILHDNVEECRERLFNLFDQKYSKLFGNHAKEACRKSIRFVLSRNIHWGDALTLKVGGKINKPITFTEWSNVNSSYVKRRDYTMENLLANQPIDGPNLFSDLGEKAFIPRPVKEYPLVYFLELDSYA